jgi:hypothetical protein
MATIEFSAHRIVEAYTYFSETEQRDVTQIVIAFDIGKAPLYPCQRVELTRLSDIQTAFSAYVRGARESGHPLQVSARVRAGRSPAGFKNARLVEFVNVDKAPRKDYRR